MNRTDILIWFDWLEDQGKDTTSLRSLPFISSPRSQLKGYISEQVLTFFDYTHSPDNLGCNYIGTLNGDGMNIIDSGGGYEYTDESHDGNGYGRILIYNF